MTKLINAYKARPTPTNRVRLQTYLRRHPMAVCMASHVEVECLKAWGFN
ncbi:MAG: hypothetical protein WDN46_23005 [Methylocella sp.]